MVFKNNFDRIERLPPYVFAEVNSMKAKERSLGEDIIDFGMGNPDTPTPQHIVDKLCETIKDPKSHRYSVSRGIIGLRRAQSNYYERRFNVGVDPETEVIVTLGSKEGLANLASAIAGETHEYTDMYPGMAKTAREEGFEEIADWFETLAKAEKSHAGKFQKTLDAIK